MSSWDTNPWCDFCDPHKEIVCCKKWHAGSLKIFTAPEKFVGTHFHAWDATKTTLVFLPANGEASWSLLPSSVSLLLDHTVQPENTNSGILKVTGQVWESQKNDKHQL